MLCNGPFMKENECESPKYRLFLSRNPSLTLFTYIRVMNSLSYNIGGTPTYDGNPSVPYASSPMTPMNAPTPVAVGSSYSTNPLPTPNTAAGVYDMSSSVPMYSIPQPMPTPMTTPSQPQGASGSEVSYLPPSAYLPPMASSTVSVQPVDTQSAPISMDSSLSNPPAYAQPVNSASYPMSAQPVNPNAVAAPMPVDSTIPNSAMMPPQVVVPNAVDPSQYTVAPSSLKTITLKKG